MEENNNNKYKTGDEFIADNNLLKVYVELMKSISFAPSLDDVEQWEGILSELRQDLHLITNNVAKVDGEPGSMEWSVNVLAIIMSDAFNDFNKAFESGNKKRPYQYDLVLSSYLSIIFAPDKFPEPIQKQVMTPSSLKTIIMIQYTMWRNHLPFVNEEFTNGMSSMYSIYANHLLAAWIIVYGMPFGFNIDKINEEIDKPLDVKEFLRLFKATPTK